MDFRVSLSTVNILKWEVLKAFLNLMVEKEQEFITYKSLYIDDIKLSVQENVKNI